MRRSVSVGEKYGRWLVLSFSHKNKYGELYWNCVCNCEDKTKKAVKGRTLLNGESTSCGCYWRELMTPHGMSNTPTFKSWDSMLQRCTNPNAPDYPRWGGAGVTVCQRWRESFINFLADMGERPKGTTIDRHPKPEGNYEPGNCRWATSGEQARNRKNSRYVTYKGETKMLMDWAKEMGIPYDLLLRRVNRGLTGDDLFAPSRSKRVSRFTGKK